MKFKSTLLGLFLTTTIASIPGCPDQWWNDFVRETMTTENILDQAIIDISAHSDNWRSVLERAIQQVKPAEKQVISDLNALVNRGIGHAGIELRCDIKYMGDMIIDGLNRVKLKVEGKPIPEPTAFVCNSSVSLIDMGLDANNRNNVEVYGYNLDLPDIKLYHVTNAGERDETADFSVNSPFMRVINLGLNGIHLTPQSELLRISSGGSNLSEIPVIQAYPKVCSVRPREIPTQKVTVVPTKSGKGDDDFDGHGPCFAALVRINATSRTQIGARMTVQAWECPHDMKKVQYDYTSAYSIVDRTLYTTEAGWELAEIRSPTSATFEHIFTGTAPFSQSDTGLVSKWIAVGDTDGKDIGRTNVEITFNKILITERETGNCVTEDALAQTLSRNKLSGAFGERLQRDRPDILRKAQSLKNREKLGPRRD